jgi:saccharopine dehydrogenase-like NADP-dependent oxidoreductase
VVIYKTPKRRFVIPTIRRQVDMNVLVLGGCADMAVPLVRMLKEDDDVTAVKLADLNSEKARKIAEEMGSKFSSCKLDANDHGAVVEAMKGHNVAICYVGPFYYFEKKLASCAIEAGINYVSICDDYDAYLDVTGLEEDAKNAGVKVLTGFGNSPGITQILARKGYKEIKNPYRINVNWCAGSNEAAGPSNLTHLFHIFNGTTLQLIDGKETRVKTGKAKKTVEFPPPIGKAAVYYTGHAESVAIPRNLPGLEEVTLHGGVKPNYIVKLIKAMSALGLFSTHKRRAKLAKAFHKIEGWFQSKGYDKSVGRIDVYGKDDDGGLYRYFTYVGHIAEITSIPAYLAAKWLCAGRFDSLPGGVYSADRLLEEPDDFIQALKDKGVEIFESETVRV